MATKMATGIAKGTGGTATAEQAAKQAMAKLGGKADLAIVYCSTAYDYAEVVAAVRRVTGGAPLVGCSSAGEFTEDEAMTKAIAVGVLQSDTHRFHTAYGEGLAADPEACVKAAVGKLPEAVPGYPHRSFLVFHDGLAGKGEEAMLAAMLHLGAGNRFSGGAAGDDLAFKKTHVFCDDKVLGDALVLCLWSSKTALPIAVKHGHRPLSPTMTVTRSVGSVLHEVDGKPAWDVWKEACRAAAAKLGINVDKLSDTSEIGSFLIRYELGLETGGGEYKVRVPLAKNPDGSLGFACSIFEGSRFRIMESFEEDQIKSAGTAARNAVADPNAKKRAGVLVFDCVCRGIILGERFGEGVKAMLKETGKMPLLGFETYGEICMREGEFSGFHNTTSVVTIVPE
jgi:methyl-accepting chemotaxis protein